MSTSSNLGAMFAAPALAALGRHTQAPETIGDLLAAGAARLLDSAQIVEDEMHAFAEPPPSKVAVPLPQFPVLRAIPRLIDAVATEGFGPHALRFFGMLGAVMVELAGDAVQSDRLMGWVKEGKTGAFCMTDRGGPNASRWLSCLTTAPPRLTVDKIWAMNAADSDFGIVVARRGDSMTLAPVVVPPDVWRTAQRTPTGAAFLDGMLRLGAVSLETEFEPDWVLKQGGPISPKIFLTLARPWLIQALCAHVGWLARRGRVRLDGADERRIGFLLEAAVNQARLAAFDRFSEDQAMALKWIANEIWMDLVARGAVREKTDERDLIGFSKMEGSSYRCFFEIYQRNKKLRHVER